MGVPTAQLAQMSLIGQLAGAGQGAIGSYYSAKSQKTQLNSAAVMADVNARMAEQSAQTELMRGQREEQSSRMKTRQLKSAQRVALAANGVDLSSGTAVNIQTTTDYMGETDANTIGANAVRAAWGYRTQAVNYQNEAATKRASASGINPVISAANSLLGDAGQVAGNWYTLNKAGALPKRGK